MSSACTTCHVIVKEGFDSLGEIEESEEDLLEQGLGADADVQTELPGDRLRPGT